MAYTYAKPSATHTPIAGAIIPVASWGTKVNAALDLLAPAACVVRRAANQSVDSSSDTLVSFDTEDMDDAAFFAAGSPTKITFPRKGIYMFDVEVTFASNSTGYRHVTMPRSGGASDCQMSITAINGDSTIVRFSFMTVERAAGDYYEFNAWQNSGSPLNIISRVGVFLVQDRT